MSLSQMIFVVVQHTSSRGFRQSAAPSLPRVCLRLSQTKTGKNQWTELYTEKLGQLLALHLQHRSSSDWVFSFPSNYRASYYATSLSGMCRSGSGFLLLHSSFSSTWWGDPRSYSSSSINQSILCIVVAGSLTTPVVYIFSQATLLFSLSVFLFSCCPLLII